MQSTNLVSVLLPLYNEPVAFAKEAIDSIIKQTYQNLEIILLLDNPHNEELKKLITDYKRQDERVRIHINEENRGLPATLNIGINLATGDYIARMDGEFGKSSLFKQCKYRNFMHCEDYDFMARAYAMRSNFYNLKENLLYVRIQQKSCRSVSRKHAYEQYINTLEVRKQLNDFLNKKVQIYPVVPHIVYDARDKERYQSTIPLLNQLRESFLQKKFWKSGRRDST